MSADQPQVAVVGGGIVGLATAYALLRRRAGLRLTLYEKEADLGRHQTGRNSGVVHSGIYYPAGSLKLRLCVEGRSRLVELCQAWDIPFRMSGKLIVAVEPHELPALEKLHLRARENGIRSRRLEGDAARELMPRVRALRAIHVEEAGLVDFGQVARRLGQELSHAGVVLRLGTRAVRARNQSGEGVVLETELGPERYEFVVNCAGLHTDTFALASGLKPELRIIPFRGEYFQLRPEAAEGLELMPVYPVPDPELPFLGVHLTPSLNGEVTAGPNAVLAWAREGYERGQLRWKEALDALGYPGFWKLGLRYWKQGLGEWLRSRDKRRFHRSISQLVDGVGIEDLEPWPAGVRAQAVRASGELVHDFVLERDGRVLHVLNAPSPAATAALAIGEQLTDRVLESLDERA